MANSPLTAPSLELPESGGSRVLRTDLRVASMLLNDTRYRTLHRVLGLSREQANLATLVLALTAAGGAHEKIRHLAAGPAMPSSTALVFGNASLRGLMLRIAGPEAGATPLFGSLLVLALLGHPTRRALAAAIHGMRSSSKRMSGDFHHRYGYLVDPGHLRLHRAQRRLAQFRDKASTGTVGTVETVASPGQ